MRQRSLPAIVACMFLFVCGTCEETGPPVINGIGGDSIVPALDTVDYRGDAWDWGLGPVWYRWEASRGHFDRDSGQEVRWFAPESSGACDVVLLVTDEDGNTTRETLAVTVNRVTRTFVSLSAAVKAELFREWRDSLRTSHSVRCEFSVEDSNRLSFYVMDDSNYGLWLDGQPFEALAARESSPEDTFTVRVPRTDWYHYVMDNTEGKQDREFWLRVRTTTP